MRITFDTEVDALTLVLSGNPVARTVDAGEGRLVDLDADGNVVAVEIIGATQGVHLYDLADSFNLEPLFTELGERVREAKEGMREDPRLREALFSH